MIFSGPMQYLIGLVIALACAASGYRAGDHNRNNAWLANQAKTERTAKEALQAAQTRGDEFSRTLLKQQDQIIQLKSEKLHAIALATTGRLCLNGPALRLLDQAPGINLRRLPPAPGSAAAAGGSAAPAGGDGDADAEYASDTQAALWIAEAGARYEVCRARLDALIGWHAR